MRIKTRIWVSFTSLACLQMLFLSGLIYSNGRQELERSTRTSLAAIAEMKRSDLQRVLGTKDEDHLSDTDWASVLALTMDRPRLAAPVRVRIVKRVGNDTLYVTGPRVWAIVPGPTASSAEPTALDAFLTGDGAPGSGRTGDDAGNATLSAWQYVPSVDWGLVVSVTAEGTTQPFGAIQHVALVVGVTILVLTGLMAFVIATSITDPLREVVDVATAIGTGDFTARIETDATGEIKQLAVCMNAMAGRLQSVTWELAMEESRTAMERQFQQDRKLAAIGQLAAGVAHEINTPAQYTGDNTVFLKGAFGDLMDAVQACQVLVAAAKQAETAPDLVAKADKALKKAEVAFMSKEVPRAIEQSLNGLRRISEIVGAMKEFAHPGRGEKQAVDLGHAINTTLKVARNEWKYVANVETCFDPDLSPVPCVPDEFNQVILNLVVNAAHAVSDVTEGANQGKGTISLTTQKRGEWAEIRVSDSGTGIAEEIQGRIFDPFFRLYPSFPNGVST